jgi:serine/threonine protein kinase
VTHPNVIKLYSVGYDQGYFYIAMELVGGGSLEQRIRREGHLKEAEALRIGREVAEGCGPRSSSTLIHRDVKPANILFTETGTAKVVDFGLALFVRPRRRSVRRNLGHALLRRAGKSHRKQGGLPQRHLQPRRHALSCDDRQSAAQGGHQCHRGSAPHQMQTRRPGRIRPAFLTPHRACHQRHAQLPPEERFSNYDEVVDEMRLAEGLLDRGGVRRRLFSRRAKLISAIAAAITLAYGVGWLLREGGERRATGGHPDFPRQRP